MTTILVLIFAVYLWQTSWIGKIIGGLIILGYFINKLEPIIKDIEKYIEKVKYREKIDGKKPIWKNPLAWGALLILIALFVFNDSEEAIEQVNNETHVATSTNETQSKIDVSKYKVVSTNDISAGPNKRYEYWVVPDLMVTEEEIKLISEDLLKKAKTEHKFNAVVFWFIDDERQVDNGYTIAKVEYAPNGIWSEAGSVKKGEYSTHKFIYYFGSPVTGKLPKDNPDYPTKEELDIYFYHMELYKQLNTPDKDPRKVSDEVSRRTAEKFGISFEEENEIIIKAQLR